MIEDTSKHVCVYNHDVRICSEGAVLILEHLRDVIWMKQEINVETKY